MKGGVYGGCATFASKLWQLGLVLCLKDNWHLDLDLWIENLEVFHDFSKCDDKSCDTTSEQPAFNEPERLLIQFNYYLMLGAENKQEN